MYLEVIGKSAISQGVAADTRYYQSFGDGKLLRAETDNAGVLNSLIWNSAADNPFGSAATYTVAARSSSNPDFTIRDEAGVVIAEN